MSPLKQVALDTSILVGLIDSRDIWHPAAFALRDALKDAQAQLVHFDCVISEAINVLARRDRLGELLLLGLSQIKIQEVLLLYQRGLVSFGRAAELTGLSEQEMVRQAKAFGVFPRWSEKMAEEEAA